MLQLVLEQHGVEVAASLVGELRGATSPLHKKKGGEALGVRKGTRNEMEESGCQIDVGGDQNTPKTVAATASSDEQLCSLEARNGWEEEGKWKRGPWALCRRRESGVSTP